MTRSNLDKLEATALTATVADLILTVMLYGSNFATEQNGVAEALIRELGWMPAAVLGVSVVALGFAVARRRIKPHYPRIAVGAGGLFTAVSVAPVANNLRVLYTTGIPDSLPMVTGEVALIASVAAVVAYSKPDPRPALQRVGEAAPRPTGQQVATVALTALVVTSMVGGVMQFGVGTAEAAESSWEEVWTASSSDTYGGSVDTLSQTGDRVYYAEVDGSNGIYRVVSLNKSDSSEVWSHEHYADTINTVHGTDSAVYSGYNDGTVVAADASDGSELWNTTLSANSVESIVEDNGTVFVGHNSGITALDGSDGSQKWSIDSNSVAEVELGPNGYLYVGTFEKVVKYDQSGSVIWEKSVGSTVMNVGVDDGVVVAGDDSNNVAYGLDASDGSQMWSQSSGISAHDVEVEGDIVYTTSVDNLVMVDAQDGTVLDESHTFHSNYPATSIKVGGSGDVYSLRDSDGVVRATPPQQYFTQPVSGTVEDQTGAPVSSATVEVWGTYSSVGSISEQESTLDDLADPTPPNFDSDFDAKASLVENSDVEGDVPLVYTKSEIGATAYSDGPSMQTPRVQVPAGEPFTVVRWDPSASSGLLGTADAYERQLQGEPSSGKVKIERLGPGGDSTDTLTVETDERISSDALGVTTRLQYAEVSLSPGYYEVTSINEDGQNYSYQMQVGSGEEILNLVRDDLQDTQEQLSDRAKQVRDAINNERVYRTTVTTDSKGNFSAQVPSGVQVVQVQAYSAGGVLDGVDPSNRSLSEARSLAEGQDYNGKWYIGEPQRVEAPAEGVTVNVVGFDTAPNTNMTEVMNQFDSWQEFLNSEYGDTKLADLYEERMEDVGRDRLESFYGSLKPVIESNPALQERAEELNGGELKPPEDASTEELRSQLDAMQQAVTEMESTVGGNSDVQWNDDGTVDYTFEADAGLLEGVDSYSVLAIAPDGSTEPVPDEKVSVSGDTVSVEGYEVPDGQSGVKFRLVADAGEEIVQDATRSVNPAFSGNVPALSSISVGTNIPQVGETVTMELNPEDEFTYGSVQSVSVYGPSGEQNATVVDGQTVRFTPDAAGEHDVRVTYTNSGGTQFTESVTLQAKENAKTTPPSVRIVDGTNSRYALASGVEAATVETVSEGSSIDVTVQLARGEIPSEIDIYAGSVVSGPQQEIDVQVVEGAEQSAVSEQIAVQVHTGEIGDAPSPWSDGAVVERVAGGDGEPIPRSGGAAGDVTEKESSGTTITTYTGESGGVTVSVNNDPGLVERMSFWASQQIPDISLPFGSLGGGVDVNTGGFGGVAIGGIGLAGLFARRRGV